MDGMNALNAVTGSRREEKKIKGGSMELMGFKIGGIMNIDWSKLSSGKFIFTVVTAVVFAYCVHARILPADKITEIILIVVYAYFNKKETPTEEKKA